MQNHKVFHLGKLSTKEFLANLTLKLMSRRKKKNRKSSFPGILKQTTINIPSQNQSLKHSSPSICSKNFDSPITDPYRHSSPLMTLMKVGSNCASWHDHNYNTKTIVLNDRDSFFNKELINFFQPMFHYCTH